MTPFPSEVELNKLFSYPDPAALLDRNYRILATNESYREIFHHGEEMAGRTCYQVSHGFDKPCDEAGENCPLKASMRSGSPERMIHIHNLPVGKEFVVVEIIPIKGNGKNPIYFLEVLKQTLIASAQPKATGLVGVSPRFMHLLDEVHKVAHTSVPVLLLGESGTGKELIARALHDASDRANAPFVPVECSGLTETLFESELFGHRKGSFTGALADKNGLVDAVSGGTLFMDEIGDVPHALQVKLLRLLESHTYRKVGDTKPQRANFRLVCATNRNLDKMMAQGQFRQDLYYRISTYPIHLPPLRERLEDIGLLAQSILKRIAPERVIQLSTEVLFLLRNYYFPGNIRELVNLLERARIKAGGQTLTPEHFPDLLSQTHVTTVEGIPRSAYYSITEPMTFKALESHYLRHMLNGHPGNQAQLAQILGVSLRTLTRKIAELR
ncbi:MAG: sigma-54-dependent Fis family transcriptional regulator [Magnetococcus sp. THC-1_WYH]